MNNYEDGAYTMAQQQGLASVDVAALGYAAIAGLAGVTLTGVNEDESPDDFFYSAVRHAVVERLARDEWQAARDQAISRMMTLVTNEPGWGAATCEWDNDGRLAIVIPGVS